MLTKILDRILILVFLYFLYMLIFHLPSQCNNNNNINNNNFDPNKITNNNNNNNKNNNNINRNFNNTCNEEDKEDYNNSYDINDDNMLLCRKNKQANILMQRFLKTQNAHLDSIKEGGKFIIYAATDLAGLGNRVPALIASFMLALVLDRGFLVYWPEVSERHTMDKYDEDNMVMPMFSDLFIPPVPIDLMSIPSYNSIFDDSKTATLKLDESADLLMCGDLEAAMADYDFVVVKGWRPFFDLLFHNEWVVSRIERLQLVTLVHDLANCLLRPIPLVHELVRQFKAQNFITKHHKLVGVHIRKQSQHGLTKKEQEGLWSCVRKKYPPPYNSELDDWESYYYDDDENSKSGTNGIVVQPPENPAKFRNVTYLYFLASDSNATIAMVPPDILPYVVRVNGDIVRNTNDGIVRALVDIWILGHSVELYGAQGTTFLSAVRTLFPSKTNLATLGNNKVDKYCRAVGALPCYKWWDIFKSQHAANFSLSCFHGSASSKQMVVC